MKRYLLIIIMVVASVVTMMQKDALAVPFLDLNYDGEVNDADTAAFVTIFQSGIYNADADYNNNNRIDAIDYQLFTGYMNDYQTQGTQSVPEPATLALMGMGLLALSGMSIRKRYKKNLDK